MASDAGNSHMHAHGTGHVDAAIGDKGLGWSAAANIVLTVFQVIAGVIAGSIALVADALHNLSDALALVVAIIARRVGRRRADERFTFGYRRAELIGATINLTALIVVGLFLLVEAVPRLFHPTPVHGQWVMAAAGVALAVDIGTAVALWATARGGLNLRAVFLHNLTDALASVAVLAGGAAVHFLGWNWIDPALTVAIAGYVLVSAVRMLRRCVRILMEGTPHRLDPQAVRVAVEALPGVAGLHHLHVWEIDEEQRALEAHVVLQAAAEQERAGVTRAVKDLLRERFGIGHATLEVESATAECGDREAGLIPDHR